MSINTLDQNTIIMLFQYLFERLLQRNVNIDAQLFASLLLHIWDYYLINFSRSNNIQECLFHNFNIKEKFSFVIYFLKHKKEHKPILLNLYKYFYINSDWSKEYRKLVNKIMNNHIVKARFLLKKIVENE